MNYLKILLAIGLFVIGIPGLLDDVVEWRDWMTLASWWNILLMATGLLLFVHAVFKRNLREQILKVWAYLVALFTVPDWLVEARGKQSFELYELACLIARVKPYWPLPSDEAESVYKEILQDLPEEVIYKHLTEGCSAVRNVELSRRQARECVPPKYWDYVGSGSSLRKKYPWFIREAFDQVIPDGRTDEDDRKLIAKRSDKDSDSLASRQERRNTMYDPELMIALLGEMAEQPNGRISFPVHLGYVYSRTETETPH